MPRLALLAAAPLLLVPVSMAETRSYDVPAFADIDVSAGITLEFAAGGAQTVLVENAKGDFDDIEISVRDGTLDIGRPTRMGWNFSRPRYTVTVTAPQLSGLDVSSGADATGSGLSGPDVFVEVSSGASAEVSDIDAGRVSLETNSGANMIVSGVCDDVRAESSSGSALAARNLVCSAGRAEASSGSDTMIHTTLSVRAEASSGADVVVYGSPESVVEDSSSGGDVTLRS